MNSAARLPTLALVLVLVLAVLAAGCATLHSDPLPEIRVTARPDGRHFDVENRLVPLNELGKALKKAGATGDTQVFVQIQPNQSRSGLGAISAALARAGFRKILFTTPRHASVEVHDENAPPPAPTPPRSRR